MTPPVTDNILEGVTRDTIRRLAAEELGVAVEERPVDRSELYVADEVFLSGTGAEVVPVVEVDRWPVGSGARSRAASSVPLPPGAVRTWTSTRSPSAASGPGSCP